MSTAENRPNTAAPALPQAEPQFRATRAAKILAVDPPVTKEGISFESADDHQCTMTMQVRAEHCNSHKICHGGFTMHLADTTAAYALNTGEESPCWVTSSSQSFFLAPARQGSLLRATATIHQLSGRNSVVDIQVRDDQGTVVLETRNMMTRLKTGG